jgi:hypothetical protein
MTPALETKLWAADYRGIGVRFKAGARRVSPRHGVQFGSGARPLFHLPSNLTSTQGLLPWM